MLCRSASTGSQRHTAVWTGDNYSNYHHLACSIPTSLNLALSGIPFNGADVGGFGADTWEDLLIDWTKAAFLSPFMRNHSIRDSRRQEPWAFDERVLAVTREYIQLRYRLRPYLYNLFAEHEISGEAILRPLFYDFPEDRRLDEVCDQFMVGPAVMQAPFISEGVCAHRVVLPAGSWYAVDQAAWVEGGVILERTKTDAATPLFLRGGAILPWSTLEPGSNRWDGSAVDFLVFLRQGAGSAVYRWDDGVSFRYLEGERSEGHLRAEAGEGEVRLLFRHASRGFGSLVPRFLIVGRPRRVRLEVDGIERTVELRTERLRIAGVDHQFTRVVTAG